MDLSEEKRTKKQLQTIMPEDIECAIVQMQSNMDAQVKKNSRTNSSYGFYGN